MPNRLAEESSPYLLQHQENPVDWYPWSEEAFELAKAEDKPVFLSIGYSACHWCHVMEHESFENPAIADQLNRQFVSVKVDREERPDLDQIYMNAVQMLTGRGGWPMSVFLTPDQRPFYGGTYWPPSSRMGMPGFPQILDAVHEAWSERREQLLESATDLTAKLALVAAAPAASGELNIELLDAAAAALERSFDFRHGGFGGAPKFPHSMDLQVLARYWRRHRREGVLDMIRLALDKMAAGGIYDHLGGGFARYSVDERWLVPHFEKMLYDNALLVGAYLDGYLITGEDRYLRTVRETLDFWLAEMTDPAGGFYSTLDADSEGEEGKFYVWTTDEIQALLGPDAAKTFNYVYDVTDEGNFEGKNILNLPKAFEQCAAILSRELEELNRELAESRAKLLAARAERVPPGLDDKVLVSWNGLMIDAMAQAAAILDEPRYLEAATRAADFVLEELSRGDGRLLHTWRRGEAKLDAYLDDYAAMVGALVSVYEAGFEERFIDQAVRLAESMFDLFRDPQQGGFFYTARDHEALITRTKDFQDSSVPSGNSLAAAALLRLGRLTGNAEFVHAAEQTLQAASGLMREHAMAAGQMLLALDDYLSPPREIALLADLQDADTRQVLAALRRRLLPGSVVALRPLEAKETSPALDPLFSGKQPAGETPTVFICENFACRAPLSGKAAALAAWDELAASPE